MSKSKLLFLFIAVGVLFACTKEDPVNKTQAEELGVTPNLKANLNVNPAIYNDPQFNAYLTASYNHFELNHNAAQIQSYIADNKLTNAELSVIHTAFGYSTKAQLDGYVLAQKNRLIYLENNYGLSSMNTLGREQIILEGYNRLNLPFYDPINDPNSPMTQCERKFRNCKRKANMAAVAMHAGCALLDVTAIPGLICHGAALVWQAAALDDCVADYEDCTP